MSDLLGLEEAQARLLALANPRMLAFTGITEPSPAVIARLDAARVEAITGTLTASAISRVSARS